jgi:hypothetical protein
VDALDDCVLDENLVFPSALTLHRRSMCHRSIAVLRTQLLSRSEFRFLRHMAEFWQFVAGIPDEAVGEWLARPQGHYTCTDCDHTCYDLCGHE